MIEKGGKVLFEYKQTGFADHPTMKDILDSLGISGMDIIVSKFDDFECGNKIILYKFYFFVFSNSAKVEGSDKKPTPQCDEDACKL